ncbi:MAG: hypothetical protein M0Z60_09505 [Nitrospiraceae bacterium]|nr:hypothetical protein [Nitrospiraceae bacterium]
MKDIEVIGGDLDYGKIEILPYVYDRTKSIFYHHNLIEQFCSSLEFSKATWHFRSALSEFKSIFDVLAYDLRKLQLDKIWQSSQVSQNLEKDVLIKVLKKTRDLAIHTAYIKGDKRRFCFTVLDGSGERYRSDERIFIDPINRYHCKRDGSGKKSTSLTNEEIEWFDRQTHFWPAHLIIEEALFCTCVELINFLTVNQK